MVSEPLAGDALQVAVTAPVAAAAQAQAQAPALAPDVPMPARHVAMLIGYCIAFFFLPAAVIYLFYAKPSVWMLAGDARSLLLAALMGMAMGAVHGLASISVHAGKRDLGTAWYSYYICRPFTGGGIALVTCLILMSGLGGFSVPADNDSKRQLVLLAWAALAGLYSQSALDKLKELFGTLFATKDKTAGAVAGQAANPGAKNDGDA